MLHNLIHQSLSRSFHQSYNRLKFLRKEQILCLTGVALCPIVERLKLAKAIEYPKPRLLGEPQNS
jgi:hypothetical protein